MQFVPDAICRTNQKRVLCPINGELIGHAADVLIFPPGSVVTLENRPVLNDGYRAICVCFPHHMIEAIFSNEKSRAKLIGIQILRTCSDQTLEVLTTIQATLKNTRLPPSVRQHRLLEPLVWLKHHGIQLSSHEDEKPLSRIRRLIETDLSHLELPENPSNALVGFMTRANMLDSTSITAVYHR